MLNIDNDISKTCVDDYNITIFAATVPNLFPIRTAIGSSYFRTFPISFVNKPQNSH